MSESLKNNIRLSVSVIAIIGGFFCGYLYAMREFHITQNTQEVFYIDVTRNTRNITIKNMPENIFFRVDGAIVQSGSIDLK